MLSWHSICYYLFGIVYDSCCCRYHFTSQSLRFDSSNTDVIANSECTAKNASIRVNYEAINVVAITRVASS